MRPRAVVLAATLPLILAAPLYAVAPADQDRDGDVDQSDFGTFQVCYTGIDVPQIEPECQAARLDDDGDVDVDDFDLLAACMSGAGVPAAAPCAVEARYFFPRASVWYQDVSQAPLDAQSDAVINWLSSAGGWGTGTMRIDFSIEVLTADETTPIRSFIPTGDHFSPDCDFDDVPVPPGGALEGESGYACVSEGDCHLIVVHEPTQRLYEMWRANIVSNVFYGGCLVVWDMTYAYPPAGRGENCTSADAAGYPIAPLLFTADEVAAGWIDHAIRFILPNSRIRNGVYVHPATHSTSATGGGSNAPPYGTRLRLRADYPLNALPNDGARVVARALQHYGMVLADGGQIALTARSDRFTASKWQGLLGPHDLNTLQVTDFEMVEAGPRIAYTGDCVRLPRP